MGRRLSMATLLAILFWIAPAAEVRAQEPAPVGPSLGLLLGSAPPEGWREICAGEAGRPLAVRLQARWAEVERAPGSYDWSALEPAVDGLHRSGCRITLGLTGSHPDYLPTGEPPSPFEPEAMEAWLEFVSSAVRAFAGRVEVVEIWGDPGDVADVPASARFEPDQYAFLLKQSSLEARGEADAMGKTIRIAQAAVPPSALDWQKALWASDSAAYVDVLPLIFDAQAGQDDIRRQVDSLVRENLLFPPAAELWAYVAPAADPRSWSPVGVALQALASGAERALVSADGPPDGRAWVRNADRLLVAGYAPAPPGALRFLDGEGAPLESGAVLGRFFSAADFSTVIFYELPGDSGELPTDRLVLDTSFVLNPRILDLVSGEERRVSSGPPPGGGVGKAIRVAAGDHPLVLFFEKPASDGFELPPEEVETTRTRELTAEEIIARYQQVQEVQDEALERWMASARIDFHFKFAQGGPTIDVGIDSTYFWERGGQVEWEQTGYSIQGNRVTWKNIPQIPYIQPAKVATLPLDLTLDKTYRFRLVGRDKVRGREAYVLEFQPLDPDADRSLYRGRIWIDTETFVRVMANLVQTNLEPPVLSNEERDHFRAETGPGGRDFWLLDTIDGQQLWTVAGRNLVVRREVTFTAYQLNPSVAQFEARRQQAYASKNQMLRDTDEGFRYLERQDDGSRVVTDKMKTSQLFAAVGAFQDDSTDGVQPIAGVNYFNFNVFGSDTQVNALFGGVVLFANATKPSLFGTRMDLSGDLVAIAIKTQDKLFAGDQELELERIDQRNNGLQVRLGIPAGQFTKFTLIGGIGFNNYYENEDTFALYDAIRQDPADPRDLRYVLPQDHTLYTGRLLAEFNRRGYSLILTAAQSTRSDWGEYGLRDEAAGTWLIYDGESGEYVPSAEPEPVHDSFSRWNISGFKEWILPSFQKFRAEVNWMDGSNLDRFSRYQFSLFGQDRLDGFSGSGLRFDRGGVVRAAYSFNVLEAIRFNANVESARVETRDSGDGFQSFTGIGLSGNVVGPWQTIWSLSYGYALASDIPDLEGQQQFFLLILKLF